jgi:hypothetical protein
MPDLREQAERAMRNGVIGFATAFNLKGARMDWRFEPGVEEIAEDMVIKLIALFDQSQITSATLEPIRQLRPPRNGDHAFNRFMARALERPRRR